MTDNFNAEFSNRELDNRILKLEQNLQSSAEPDELIKLTGNLVTLLDFHTPTVEGLGPFSDCQLSISSQHGKLVENPELLKPSHLSTRFRAMQRAIQAFGLSLPFSILQGYAGQLHNIGGQKARCEDYLALFNRERVIASPCFSCFKVQILPDNLLALIQVYFILRMMKLPRDNGRKAMVELREGVKYPYKGYIYCDSETEAEMCLDDMQAELNNHNVKGVRMALSHGCSEFGLEYPEWKYSPRGSHRQFRQPAEWKVREQEFLKPAEDAAFDVRHHNRPGVTLRDAFLLQNWVEYAAAIDDTSWTRFVEKPFERISPVYARALQEQAKTRAAERSELQDMMASA